MNERKQIIVICVTGIPQTEKKSLLILQFNSCIVVEKMSRSKLISGEKQFSVSVVLS